MLFISISCFFQLLPYDYYGSYGLDKHSNYEYQDRLEDDYTFGFPAHHDIVSYYPTTIMDHMG